MNPEFEKIHYYFEEGKKLWTAMSDHVISRDFYVLWENVQKPLPFLVEDSSISLFEHCYQLKGEDEEKTAFFHWDMEEECATLVIESESWEHKFLLTFDNGEPRVYETEPFFLEKLELEHGEKLEIIYDIIYHINEENPSKDVLNLTKKEYLEVLEILEARYDLITIKAMRRLPAFSIKKLLKNAAEDMALDEISSQLSLPLDGSYAHSTSEQGSITDEVSNREIRHKVKSKTAWEITNSLNFLSISCKNTYDAEKFYVLNFKDAIFIGNSNGTEITVKFKTSDNLMLHEGDLLKVYSKGCREPFGTFKIDLYDGFYIYGRLRWRCCEDIMTLKDSLFARPRKSPREFIYLSVEGMTNWFKLDKAEKQIKGALCAALGMNEATIYTSIPKNAPEKLDSSQRKAWGCATDNRNPVVLIQGPPGTGKTSVLEQVVRTLCKQKKRILVTAPSNTAVDNICRRIFDLPVLRFGRNVESIAPDVHKKCWVGIDKNVRNFMDKRQESNTGGVFVGTHIALLRDDIIAGDIEQNGLYDVIIYDEAGMASIQEFLLSGKMGKRVILFGDHQQLPPFPLPPNILEKNRSDFGPLSKSLLAMNNKSALEWLVTERGFPVIMLQCSYRCQNPRLLRFASTLFYDAGVKASDQADYYQLPYHERQEKYPPSSLKLLKTSELPFELRKEKIFLEGCKPGLENLLEARICCKIIYEAMEKYPLSEITLISPYRRQVKLIRDMMSREKTMEIIGKNIPERLWEVFLFTRISTVDSFQGGESDIVIISYVRSPEENSIGFVDDANRINVAHTRCRREMIIIGDMESLKHNARNNIFVRMERAFERDGEVVNITEQEAAELEKEFPEPGSPVPPEEQCA